MAVERLLAGGDVPARDQLQGFVGASLLGEDPGLRELAESLGACGSAALDIACRQADGADDPHHQQCHDHRGGDQAEVEASIRALQHDCRADGDRRQGDKKQHETGRSEASRRAAAPGRPGQGRRRRPSPRRAAAWPASTTTPHGGRQTRSGSPARCWLARPRPNRCRSPIALTRRPAPCGFRHRVPRRSRRPARMPLTPELVDIAPASRVSVYRPERKAVAAAASAADEAAYRFCAA